MSMGITIAHSIAWVAWFFIAHQSCGILAPVYRLFRIKNATSSAYNMILLQYQGTYVILFIQFIYKM